MTQSLEDYLAEAGITICGDNSCMFGHPGGVGTNGGCRCIGRDGGIPPEAMRFIRRLARVAVRLSEGV